MSFLCWGPQCWTGRILQVGSQKIWVDGENHLPWSCWPNFFWCTHDTVGFLGWKHKLLAHVELFINKHSQVLIIRAALSIGVSQIYSSLLQNSIFICCPYIIWCQNKIQEEEKTKGYTCPIHEPYKCTYIHHIDKMLSLTPFKKNLFSFLYFSFSSLVYRKLEFFYCWLVFLWCVYIINAIFSVFIS